MGESLGEYIARLETLADKQRLRVPRRYVDAQGNVIVHVAHIYGVDTDGTPHELVDTSGKLLAHDWPAGTTVEYDGTFTKSGAGTGSISIVPASGDELMIISGHGKFTGHAAAGQLVFAKKLSTGTQFTIFANTAAGTDKECAIPRTMTSITGSNAQITTGVLSHLISDGQTLYIYNTTMGDTETFLLRLELRSRLGLTPTRTDSGGAFA